MSSARPTNQQRPMRIGRTLFLCIQWGGVIVTILLFAFRILVRLKVFRRLHADDGLVFVAWILLLINTILWQVSAETLYELSAVASGERYPPPADFAHLSERFWPKALLVLILFLAGVWTIKLSFLVFFKRLGNGVKHQEKIWWMVLSFTVASFLAAFGTISYDCMTGSFQHIQTNCPLTPSALKKVRHVQYAQMILDVLSDGLIIVVPINLIWKVRLSLRKRLALGGIFSITIITMVFTVMRVALVNIRGRQSDPIWFYLWTSLEQAISIVVACLASFPALFKESENGRHQQTSSPLQTSTWSQNRPRTFFFSRDRNSSKATTPNFSRLHVNKESDAAAQRF